MVLNTEENLGEDTYNLHLPLKVQNPMEKRDEKHATQYFKIK